MDNSKEMHIVTEVGTFGSLNINDPTKKKIKPEDQDIDSVIKDAIAENAKNLINK